jgi:hypothetical protein
MQQMQHEQALATRAAERYQLGEMTEQERYAFEAHYFECQECADDVLAGARLEDAVRLGEPPARIAAFSADNRPRQVDAPDEHRRLAVVIPLAAAAVLALVAGYQALVLVPALREASGPQALTPIVLRPLSRGDLPVVPAGSGLVTLALDVNFPVTAAGLVYDLQTDAGSMVSTGPVPAPPSGVPLLLLLPGNTLTTGRHVLTLRDASDRSIEIGVYRFIVQ